MTMQEEASYTGTSVIQYRESIRLLHLKAESRSQTHVYLDGPAGCGKSIALVSLVDWARSQGWLVSTGIFLAQAFFLHRHFSCFLQSWFVYTWSFSRNADVLESVVHTAFWPINAAAPMYTRQCQCMHCCYVVCSSCRSSQCQVSTHHCTVSNFLHYVYVA